MAEEIKKGDQAIVMANLEEELTALGFEEPKILNHYIGTKQKVFGVWEDEEENKYATIDLCIEIPLQCLKKI